MDTLEGKSLCASSRKPLVQRQQSDAGLANEVDY